MLLAQLRFGKTVTQRKHALARMERFLLERHEWPSALRSSPVADQLEHIDRDHVWLRDIIGRLLSSSKTWSTRQECRDSVVAHWGELLGNEKVAFTGDMRRLANTSDAHWQYWLAVTTQGLASDLAWSTIHGAKGQEFDAVLLSAPKKAVIEDWVNGLHSEDRRVFYVGASRAKRLLAIHVSVARKQELVAAFEKAGVALELI